MNRPARLTALAVTAAALAAPAAAHATSAGEIALKARGGAFAPPQAQASTSCPTRGDSGICWWKVRKVIPFPGKPTTHHDWVDCVRFEKSKLVQHITCSISESESDTTTATLGGAVEVKAADLSASVGYSVTETTTVTTGSTVDVPRKTAGVVQWAAVYGDRKSVIQEFTPCYQSSPAHFDACEHRAHPKTENLAVAYTEKYQSPIFRVVKYK